MIQTPTLKNWIFLITLGIIWGASFMAVDLALTSLGPLSVAAGRLTFGAIALYVLMRSRGARLPPLGRVWIYIIGMGIFTNALPFSLLSWGQQSVPSAFAGVSMAVVPLFTLPLAFLFVPGETLPPRKIIGFIVGFGGMLLLIGIADIQAALSTGTLLPKLACVAAAACYAVGSILTRLSPKIPQMSFSAGGLLVGACISFPLALAFEGIPNQITVTAAGALAFLALFPTALATLLLVQVIQSAGPTFMVQVNYQVPVWSLIFGVTFLSETLPPNFLIAFGLILAGLLISQSGRRNFNRPA
ncbi:DMT family transporter [Algirhabdus cladophorae]|uniref:DMT family transporter n=1 Tax=Algirhabdus cladophorae TaxID=3377108 RepID=UPI003B8496B7